MAYATIFESFVSYATKNPLIVLDKLHGSLVVNDRWS